MKRLSALVIASIVFFPALGSGLDLDIDKIAAAINDGPDLGPFVLKPDPHWIGLSLSLGYRGLSPFQTVDTVLWIGLGLKFWERGYFRLPDGSVYDGNSSSVDPLRDIPFFSLDTHWKLGIVQGLIKREGEKKNWWEIFLFYRGIYDYYCKEDGSEKLFFLSGRPETAGLLLNSLFIGTSLDTVTRAETDKSYRGYYSEITFEWAPGWLANAVAGEADFMRLYVTAKGFIPLFHTFSDEGKHRFSLYGGARIAADLLYGSKIPLHALQSFGGRDPEIGLGKAVRGADSGRFGTKLKIVGNVELRGNLPALIWDDLIPGVLVYVDAGYYDNLDDTLSGPLCSTGIGLFLDFFGLGELIVYTQYLLNRTNVDGLHITPINIDFGFHF